MLETHNRARTLESSPLIRAGEVRRFGPDGVLYEVLKLIDGEKALIRVLDTDEQFAYAIRKILADLHD